MTVPTAIRTAHPTIEVWTPSNGEPVTINVGHHICTDWYHYTIAMTSANGLGKLRSISNGAPNPDELDGLFAGLKEVPQLQRFSVERDTITLWLKPYVQWSSIKPYVERALRQLPFFQGSNPSFAVHA